VGNFGALFFAEQRHAAGKGEHHGLHALVQAGEGLAQMQVKVEFDWNI
jgi:ribosomal protein L16/L10AE